MASFDEQTPEESSPQSDWRYEVSAIDEPLPFIEHMLEEMEALLVVHDRAGRVVLFNEAAEQASGYDRAEVLGEPLVERLVAPEDRERVRAAHEQLVAGATTRHVEYWWEGKSGQRRYIRWRARSLADEQGRVQRVIATGIDLTRQRELERETVSADEALRRQFGQELHDTLASHLTGVALMAAALTRKEVRGEMAGADALRELTDLIREGAEQVRALSHSFVVPELEAEDLAEALDQLAERTETTSGVTCVCAVEEAARSAVPSQEVATHLYRIAQEAVSNAILHGAPEHIDISLGVEDVSAEERALTLSVRDNGSGLPDEIAEGIGLRNMRRRAELIGASMNIEEVDAGGTRVRCTLPLSNVSET